MSQNSYQAPQKTNGFAITGFVLSLLGCTGVLGLIFSAISLNQFKKNPNQGGKGLAIAGLVIGILDVIGIVIYWIVVAAAVSTIQ
jgi:hypothetical protein